MKIGQTKKTYCSKLLLLLATFFLINLLSGQNKETLKINVTPLLNRLPLTINDQENDTLNIRTLKFYLTNFTLSKAGKKIWQEENSHHLIDLSKPNSQFFNLAIGSINQFDSIHFLLGTDSLINVSGVMGADLDPTKGMYWAWNSGYINFKLEGSFKLKPFEFHLGGYMPPYQTARNISLKIMPNNSINIYLDLSKFLNNIDTSIKMKVMSPGQEAQHLSKIAASIFYSNETR